MFPRSAQRYQQLMEERSFWLNGTCVLTVHRVVIKPPDAGTNTRAVTVDNPITLPSVIAIE